MKKPYYHDDRHGVTIYHGDCREIMPSLAFDVVVTDPPYGVGSRGADWDKVIPSGWLDLARKHARLVAFTTAPTTLWDYPRPDWVMCAARPGSTSRTATGGFNHWTPIVVYGRGSWSPDMHSEPDCLRVNDNAGIDHPCPKSLSLMRWIVRGTIEGTILDPFMGSGTTLVAARELGRRAIGIEIEERYCEIAAKRLDQNLLPFDGKETEAV